MRDMVDKPLKYRLPAAALAVLLAATACSAEDVELRPTPDSSVSSTPQQPSQPPAAGYAIEGYKKLEILSGEICGKLVSRALARDTNVSIAPVMNDDGVPSFNVTALIGKTRFVQAEVNSPSGDVAADHHCTGSIVAGESQTPQARDDLFENQDIDSDADGTHVRASFGGMDGINTMTIKNGLNIPQLPLPKQQEPGGTTSIKFTNPYFTVRQDVVPLDQTGYSQLTQGLDYIKTTYRARA